MTSSWRKRMTSVVVRCWGYLALSLLSHQLLNSFESRLSFRRRPHHRYVQHALLTPRHALPLSRRCLPHLAVCISRTGLGLFRVWEVRDAQSWRSTTRSSKSNVRGLPSIKQGVGGAENGCGDEFVSCEFVTAKWARRAICGQIDERMRERENEAATKSVR